MPLVRKYLDREISALEVHLYTWSDCLRLMSEWSEDARRDLNSKKVKIIKNHDITENNAWYDYPTVTPKSTKIVEGL